MGDIVLKWYKGFCFLAIISIIGSCSVIAPFSSSSTTIKQLSVAKTTVELISEHYTDKSATDHVVSAVLRKDCKIIRVAKREKICNEIKTRVYDYKNRNEMNMIFSLRETDIVNLNQNFVDNKKKVDDIKKNNVEVLKNNVEVLKVNDNEILAHSVLNNGNIIEDNSDNSILANNLSSIYIPLAKDTNEIKFSENL